MLTAWLLFALFLQESRPATAEQALQKAILVEEGERDSARAEALYREVAAAQAWPEAVRAQARVRLARLLQRAGRVEEARAELTAVAAGNGAAAETAKALLEQKPGAEDDALRARVDGLLRKIQTTTGEERTRWIGELRWLGQKAVPHVANAALLAGNDLEYVTVLSQVIQGIGGPEAMAYFRRVATLEDVDYRRSVLRFYEGAAYGFSPPREYDAVARVFWQDRDPGVRSAAFQLSILSLAELDALGQDADAGLRSYALKRVIYVLLNDRSATTQPSDLEFALRILARGLGDKDPQVQNAALDAAGAARSIAHRSEAARRLLLRMVAALPVNDLTANSSLGNADAFVPPLPAEELARTAQSMGQFDAGTRRPSGPVPPLRYDLLRFLVTGSLPGWDRSALPHVLTLASLGYGAQTDKLGEWVIKQARKEDATEVARHLGEIGMQEKVIQWLRNQGAAQQPGLAAPLCEWVRRTMAQPSWNSNATFGVFQVLVLTGKADDFLLELARTRREAFGFIANAYLKETEAKVPAEVISRLTVLPVEGTPDGKTDSVWQSNAYFRNQLFLRLLLLGQIGDAAAFGQAYTLGLQNGQPSDPDQTTLGQNSQRRGLGWFGISSREGRLLGRFTPAQLAPVFEACLAAGQNDPWHDVENLVRSTRLPPEVLDVVARHCLQTETSHRCLGPLLDGPSGDYPAREDLFARALAHTNRGVQLVALQNMKGPISSRLAPILKPALDSGNEQVVTSAIRLLAGSRSAEVRPWIQQLATHAHANVRSTVAWELSQLDTPPNLEPLVALLRDPESGPRQAACSYLERTLDRKALPHLLGAMRDPSSDVRERAEAAVRKIRFFLEQSEGAGSAPARNDTAIAAQALLAQAKTTKDKRIRIAALVSLGVLGVPEVLPGVIEFLADPDPEVAAAADAAVKQLQARK